MKELAKTLLRRVFLWAQCHYCVFRTCLGGGSGMKELVPFLIIGVVAILAALLAQPDSGRVDDRTPVRVLRYGWRFRTFVLLFFGLIPAVSVWGYLKGDVNDVADNVVMVLLNLLALYGFLEAFLVSFAFDEHGLTARSPWRKTRRIAWSEVTRYDFSDWNQWHLLRTEGKGTLRLSMYLTGLGSFFEELEHNSSVKPVIRGTDGGFFR